MSGVESNTRSLRPNRSTPKVETSPPRVDTSPLQVETSPPLPRKSRTTVSLKDKMKIISDMDRGKRRVDIARDYGISASTATYIYQRKDFVIDQYERKFGGDEEERVVPLAQALLNWFELQIVAKAPVSDPRLRRKAEEIATDLGIDDFRCTDRWLADFNATHNIVRDTRAAAVSSDSVRDEWFHLHEGYDERDVYVAGGTSLLYEADLGNYSAERECNRVSLLAATNVTGTHKHHLTVVGANTRPDVFDDITSLPVYYASSQSGLITRTDVHNFIGQWDAQLSVQNKHILLLLGNESIYKDIQTSSCIKCVNASESNTNVMFGKVLSCLKYHYRRLQIMRNLSHDTSSSRTNLLDAVRLLNLAWNCVTAQTIYDAFHPPVYGCLYFDTKSDENTLSEENDDCSLAQWAGAYDVPIATGDYPHLDKLLHCDDQLPYFDSNDSPQLPMSPTVERSEVKVTRKPSAFEAFDAARRLTRHLQCSEAPHSTLEAAGMLENHAEYGVLMEMYKEYKKNADSDASIVKIKCKVKTENEEN